jgi:hypothetical protein
MIKKKITLKVIKAFTDNDNNGKLRRIGDIYEVESIERARYLSVERKLVNVIKIEKES